MIWYIHCDGSCYNHPDHNTTGYAAVLSKGRNPEMTEVTQTKTGWQKEGTNNTAEWMALLSGMEMMIGHHKLQPQGPTIQSVEYIILTDSQLVAGQANGRWRVRNNELKYYYAEYRALEMAARGIDFEIQWIPRILNKAADAYSKLVNPYFKDKIKNELPRIQTEGDGEKGKGDRALPRNLLREY